MESLPVFPLTEEIQAFVRSGCSCAAAALSVGGVPDVAHGLACLIDPDGRYLRCVFDRPAAAPLLETVAAGASRLAIVLSMPSTHRTYQVKGIDARVLPLPAHERAQVAERVAARTVELGRIGFGGPFAAAMFTYDPAELVTIGCVPVLLYDQTPGPRAGTEIGRPT